MNAPFDNPYQAFPETDSAPTDPGEPEIQNAWRWRGRAILIQPYQLPNLCCLTGNAADLVRSDTLLLPRQFTFQMILLSVVPLVGPLAVAWLLAFGLSQRRLPVTLSRTSRERMSRSVMFGGSLLVISFVGQLVVIDRGIAEILVPLGFVAGTGVALMRMMEHNWLQPQWVGPFVCLKLHPRVIDTLPNRPAEFDVSLPRLPEWEDPLAWTDPDLRDCEEIGQDSEANDE